MLEWIENHSGFVVTASIVCCLLWGMRIKRYYINSAESWKEMTWSFPEVRVGEKLYDFSKRDVEALNETSAPSQEDVEALNETSAPSQEDVKFKKTDLELKEMTWSFPEVRVGEKLYDFFKRDVEALNETSVPSQEDVKFKKPTLNWGMSTMLHTNTEKL